MRILHPWFLSRGGLPGWRLHVLWKSCVLGPDNPISGQSTTCDCVSLSVSVSVFVSVFVFVVFFFFVVCLCCAHTLDEIDFFISESLFYLVSRVFSCSLSLSLSLSLSFFLSLTHSLNLSLSFSTPLTHFLCLSLQTFRVFSTQNFSHIVSSHLRPSLFAAFEHAPPPSNHQD